MQHKIKYMQLGFRLGEEWERKLEARLEYGGRNEGRKVTDRSTRNMWHTQRRWSWGLKVRLKKFESSNFRIALHCQQRNAQTFDVHTKWAISSKIRANSETKSSKNLLILTFWNLKSSNLSSTNSARRLMKTFTNSNIYMNDC